MKNFNLILGDFLRVRVLFGIHLYRVCVAVRLWKFFVMTIVVRRSKQEIMGVCRFHLYYRGKFIFHWCDLCGVPRIRGVNL